MSRSPLLRRRSPRLSFWLTAGFALVASLGSLLSPVASSPARAQTPVSAGFQPRTIALVGARVFLAPGQELPEATVVLRAGQIVQVAPNLAPPPDAEVIDLKGYVVYAGFLDAANSAPIDPELVPPVEAGRQLDLARYALAGTPFDNRRGISPELAAHQVLRRDPRAAEARRRFGFTTTHAVPSGRLASGSGSLISNTGLPRRETVLVPESFPQFQLLGLQQDGYPATLMGATAHLRQLFLDARRQQQHQQLYRDQAPGVTRPPEDRVLQAVGTLAAPGQTVMFLAQSRDDIHRALDFAAEHQLKPILVGAREGSRATERIKAEAVAVIAHLQPGDAPKVEPEPDPGLNPKPRDPRRVQQERLDRWTAHVANLKTLQAAGIPLALSAQGLDEPDEFWKSVRHAIDAGLTPEAALAALTRDAARILGQDRRLGTLEPGKLANLVVWTGPIEDKRSRLRQVFIEGQRFDLDLNAKPVPPPAPPAQPNAPLAGAWNLEIDAGEAKLSATVDLEQKDDKLTGSFRSPQGDGKLTRGQVKGADFEFDVAIGAGAQAIDLKFKGTVDPQDTNLAKGTLKSAFGGSTPFTARRPTAANAAPNPADASVGKLALDDKDAASPATPPGELPTELDSDRRQRHFATAGNLLIKNGIVLSGVAPPQPNCSILIRQGKIAAIGPDLMPDPGMTVIDAQGRYLAAGIIDTHSHIMFAEGMGGVNEATASLVPEVRVRDVVRTEDARAYRALSGGVTTIRMFHGSANVVGGQDAVVKLKYGELAREQLLHGNPQGVKFALGENVKRQQGRFPNTRLGVEATLNRAFLEAIDYRREWQEYNKAVAAIPAGEPNRLLAPRRDLRLEALADIVEHQKFIHSHCYRSDEILMLLRVASGLGIRVWSLQHVLEGYKVAPEIAAHGASCSTFGDWWAYKVEAFDAIPHNAALLQEAGVNVVLKSDDAELMRHLPIEASKMQRYGGVDPDTAWRMVTLNGARELGLADRIGSLEVGKDGDVVMFSGHPLSIFARCELTVIEGVPVFVRDRQPSAMTPATAAASGKPPEWTAPNAELRNKPLDLSVARGTYALKNARIHTAEGAPLERATLLVHGPHIAAVGADVAIPADVPVVDLTGFEIYPGLIDAGSILGLQEIGSLRETRDFSEGGPFQPDLRAGVGVNPDSELIPVARAGGITTTLVRPAGGLISGQSSLMQLAGWTVPEMIRDYEAALQISWPQGNDTQGAIEQLTKYLGEARTYIALRDKSKAAQVALPIADPRFEALEPYLAKRKKVHIEANSRRQIVEALQFAEKEQLAIVITGGQEAWKLAPELKRREVPVILGSIMEVPSEEYDTFDASYANAGRLFEAGVLFCIRSNASGTAGFSASNARNAPFEAGVSVAYGLPEQEALRSVTLNAARILGVEQQLGSLAAGKIANFVVTDGTPLQPATQYRGVFINGKFHAPESRQTRFYQRYRARLQEVRAAK